MGTFIKISVDNRHLDHELRKQLVSVCPVDIFEIEKQGVVISVEREDECTLCELCLDVAPSGALTIQKLYTNECLVSRKAKVDGNGAI